ncbi:MAG: protein kinase domain-containing protein, partial [Candidatus Woesearchaeota archaeon]
KITILYKLVNTIGYLHNKGVVHDDVRPQNVIITSSFDPYLIDYDVSYNINNIPEEIKNNLVYSEGYVAPEILDKAYSFKTDIFSFGVLGYELLMNRLPFDAFAKDKEGLIKQVKRGPKVPLLINLPELEHILDKCLNIDPDQRPQASEVREIFAKYVE